MTKTFLGFASLKIIYRENSTSFPTVPPYPWGSCLVKLESIITVDAFKQLLKPISFLRRRFLNTVLYIFICKNSAPPSQLWPNYILGDLDLNKAKSTLPDDAFTHISIFLNDRFLSRGYFIIYSYVKIWPPVAAPTSPGDHGLNTLESTLHEDASAWVTAFLVYQFQRKGLTKIYSMFSYVKIRSPLWPHPAPEDHVFLQLSHKFQLFGPNSSWENDLWKNFENF